jgi:hypothetical protein
MDYETCPLPKLQRMVQRELHGFAHGLNLFGALQIKLACDATIMVEAVGMEYGFAFHGDTNLAIGSSPRL